MSPPLPDHILRRLGRTEGDADTLHVLVRDQDTRRLLLLRALLDAAEAAPATVCPHRALDRLHQDWALLESAERADRAAVRTVLLHPSWAPGPSAACAASPVPDRAPNSGRTSTT